MTTETKQPKPRFSFSHALNAGWITCTLTSLDSAIAATIERDGNSSFLTAMRKATSVDAPSLTERQWLACEDVQRKYNATKDAGEETAKPAEQAAPIKNKRVSLSPFQRASVRKALVKAGGWKEYIAKQGGNIAALNKDQLFDACDALGVNVADVLSAAGEATKAAAKDVFDKPAANHGSAGVIDWQRIRTIAREECERRLEPVETVRTIVIENGKTHDTSKLVKHPNFDTLLATTACRDFSGNRFSVYLFGPTGTGKTYACKQLAELLGLPFYFHSTALEAYDLAGYEKVSGEIATTPFLTAFEFGGVCLLDEMDRYDAKALTVINAALANGRMTKPDGTQITRHPDFICVGAGNTNGNGATHEYSAAENLDKSTLSRFTCLPWGVVPEIEDQIAASKADNPALAAIWIAEIRAARAGFDRLGLPDMADQRAIEAGANLLAAGIAPEMVRDMTYLAGLSSEQRAAMVERCSGAIRATDNAVASATRN